MASAPSWGRYVALGDSFTEGIGDPLPGGRHRGWADRVAEVLAGRVDEFLYANLAVRGRLLRGIDEEQSEAAVALAPDLITVSAGGNDILRPGTDPDEVARRFDDLLGRLAATGSTIVTFTGVDVAGTPVMRALRGKVAVFNEHLRGAAARRGALVVDLWNLDALADRRMWDEDRLHLSPIGHHTVARAVLRTLGVEGLEAIEPDPLPPKPWLRARAEDLHWMREHLAPWIVRRIRRRSSGDGVAPKRPRLEPVRDETR